jgi:NIMA (never in mitosis gene a)-related kinase 1/4/5
MYFDKIRVLGKGSYGIVYLIKDSNNKKYALKRMSYNKELLKTCYNELKILKILNSDYIIKVVNYFKKSNSFNIIMEYASNGDLSQFIKKRKLMRNKLNDKEIYHYISSITKGLIHLHNNKIIHRDLKPSNILITKDNKIKLTDFGISKILNHQLAVYTKIGTPYFMSPETLDKNGYSYPVDFWALGCIFFELLTFDKPFNANSIYALYLKIKNNNFNIKKIPIKYLEIIKGLLCRNPQRRLNGTKVLNFLKHIDDNKNNLQPIYNKNILHPINKNNLQPINRKNRLEAINKNKNNIINYNRKLQIKKRNNIINNNNFKNNLRNYKLNPINRRYNKYNYQKEINVPIKKKRKFFLDPIKNKKNFIKINIENIKKN